MGSIPGSGRSPGGGIANPPQYSCLENPMDKGTWQATVHGVTELDKTEMTWHSVKINVFENQTDMSCYLMCCG